MKVSPELIHHRLIWTKKTGQIFNQDTSEVVKYYKILTSL